MKELVFLKLGGSLITDKTQPYTPRLDVLASLAAQIASAKVPMILGHGSGSFGHTAAKEYKTRDGIPRLHRDPSPEKMGYMTRGAEGGYWHGFNEVWYQASRLNRHVTESLYAAGIRSLSFAPSACVTARNGIVATWDLTSLRSALEAGLLPIIHGDVVFDEVLGGTILSTEELFEHLAYQLSPKRILLAGLEDAIWADFPARTRRVSSISPASFDGLRASIGAADGADVTGGMLSKVEKMLELVQEIPDLSIQIFSGEVPGNLEKALRGAHIGTMITAQAQS